MYQHYYYLGHDPGTPADQPGDNDCRYGCANVVDKMRGMIRAWRASGREYWW